MEYSGTIRHWHSKAINGAVVWQLGIGYVRFKQVIHFGFFSFFCKNF